MANSQDREKLLEKTVDGGWNWSHIVKKGTCVRLTDLEGGANASALFYNAANVTERYNMGDTLKIQHISYLCAARCIYSDMGRILMSVTDDSCGWHDVMGGVFDARMIAKRFGEQSYQQHHNEFFRNGYDSLLVELAKHGMGRRDFTETINFFSKVAVDEKGYMSFVENFSKPGDYVELRAEMDTLLILDTGMHPMNPSDGYLRKPVQVSIFTSLPAAKDDPCRHFCPENGRGFVNTEAYHI